MSCRQGLMGKTADGVLRGLYTLGNTNGAACEDHDLRPHDHFGSRRPRATDR